MGDPYQDSEGQDILKTGSWAWSWSLDPHWAGKQCKASFLDAKLHFKNTFSVRHSVYVGNEKDLIKIR